MSFRKPPTPKSWNRRPTFRLLGGVPKGLVSISLLLDADWARHILTTWRLLRTREQGSLLMLQKPCGSMEREWYSSGAYHWGKKRVDHMSNFPRAEECADRLVFVSPVGALREPGIIKYHGTTENKGAMWQLQGRCSTTNGYEREEEIMNSWKKKTTDLSNWKYTCTIPE